MESQKAAGGDNVSRYKSHPRRARLYNMITRDRLRFRLKGRDRRLKVTIQGQGGKKRLRLYFTIRAILPSVGVKRRAEAERPGEV
jgi:hypothetical protein